MVAAVDIILAGAAGFGAHPVAQQGLLHSRYVTDYYSPDSDICAQIRILNSVSVGGALACKLAAQIRTVAREGASSTHRTQCPHFHASGDCIAVEASKEGSANLVMSQWVTS